jgi:hypothetical protein
MSPPDTTRPDASVPDTVPQHRVLPGCVQGTFSPYFGNLHAHTSYSDGKLTPKEAFVYARDVAKLDVLVVTDHLEQLYLPLPDDRYGKCNADAAAERKPGAFFADCGFEYGSAFTPWLTSAGHSNVFFSPTLFPAVQLDFHGYYQSLAGCPDCVGQFNHPGGDKDQTFNNFEYSPQADARLNLFEFNSDAAWDLFFVALDAGWHLSPVYNQDNHGADWGTKNDRRAGLFLAQLDLPSFQAALRDRRTFMTYDKNAVIKVMADDICWMGSVLSSATTVPITVEVSDADKAEGFTIVRLYGKAKKELAQLDCKGANPCSATFTAQAGQSPYFVVRADQTDGDLLVSAPVWLAP